MRRQLRKLLPPQRIQLYKLALHQYKKDSPSNVMKLDKLIALHQLYKLW